DRCDGRCGSQAGLASWTGGYQGLRRGRCLVRAQTGDSRRESEEAKVTVAAFARRRVAASGSTLDLHLRAAELQPRQLACQLFELARTSSGQRRSPAFLRT